MANHHRGCCLRSFDWVGQRTVADLAAGAGCRKGFRFGPNGGQVIQVPNGPAADRSVAEIAGYLSLALLVIRGETGCCGPIREPTWVFIWNTEESAAWLGGYPVMINARTGKVLDCRS
jgi:hypothetical protein